MEHLRDGDKGEPPSGTLGADDPIPTEMLTGIVERVVFYNSENAWGVLNVRVPGESEPVRLVGTTTGIDPGMSIQAEGSWGEHPKYGRQFAVSGITISMPASLDAGSQIPKETLTGTVERVIFHNPKNEWWVLSVRVPEEPEPIKLVGTATGIDPGMSIQAEGSWGEHSKHGRQFEASGITISMPTSLNGMDS